ncbi:hypothetical protein AB0C10_26290 [Microbispora amethystogenes]|uniref:hypothetical protein n=1 Tax=Microbispora amethystogenes TaxID=1427754 RepID=UPI003407409B
MAARSLRTGECDAALVGAGSGSGCWRFRRTAWTTPARTRSSSTTSIPARPSPGAWRCSAPPPPGSTWTSTPRRHRWGTPDSGSPPRARPTS